MQPLALVVKDTQVHLSVMVFNTWLSGGTNAKTIVALIKNLLLVQSHNFMDLRQCDRLAVGICVLDKLIYTRPSLGIESQPNRFGMMPQYEAQIFADLGEASVHVK